MATAQTEKTSRAPRILFVDDEKPILNSLQRLARSQKWKTSGAESGENGLEFLEDQPYDVVVSDMRMGGMDGATFLSEVKDRWPDTIRILLTGYSDIDALENAVNNASIFNYITKPWDEKILAQVIERGVAFQHSERERRRLEKLIRKQNKQLKDLNQNLEARVKERTIEVEQAMSLLKITHTQTTEKFLDSMKVLTHILDWKEGRDAGHNWFVVDYASKLAEGLGVSEDELENTRIAASVHRIGMLALPDAIREKSRFEFTKEEKEQYQRVPELGEMALSSAGGLSDVGKIIRHQREWVNGKGYPDALATDEIPVPSKIIHLVSDFYDVFNGRVDANISGTKGAKRYIQQWGGKKYDQDLVDVFLPLVEDFQDVQNQSQKVASSDLQEGMMLKADIVTSKGMLLLSAGTALTNKHIDTLKGYEKTLQEEFEFLVKLNA